MNENKTQLQQVQDHLLLVGEITSWTAITKYHITRLSEYIRILRDDYNYDIDMIRMYPPNKNWYGIYKLKNINYGASFGMGN